MTIKKLTVSEPQQIFIEVSISNNYESASYSRPALEGRLYVKDKYGFRDWIGDLVGDNETDLLTKATIHLAYLEHSLRTKSLTHEKIASFIKNVPDNK